MTGTSTETYPADRCATAPHAALSLQNPQHRLLPREGNSRRPGWLCVMRRNSGEALATDAASRINQLRKSSSAASHLLSPTVSATYSSSHLEVSNFHSVSR